MAATANRLAGWCDWLGRWYLLLLLAALILGIVANVRMEFSSAPSAASMPRPPQGPLLSTTGTDLDRFPLIDETAAPLSERRKLHRTPDGKLRVGPFTGEEMKRLIKEPGFCPGADS